MSPATVFDFLRDPQMRHAAVVHFPVALSVLVPLAALVSALLLRRKTAMRWVAFVLCALLLLSALIAVNTGEDAEDDAGVMSRGAHEAVEEHQELAEKVWIFALAAGVLVVGSSVRSKPARTTSAWLAVAAGIAGAVWVGVTAHHGGALVYEWGLGAPAAAAGDDEGGGDPRLVFFREHVQPIIEKKCMRCHNPGRDELPGDLDQTTIAGLLRGGEHGPAVVPGHPEESMMLRAVRGEGGLEPMPPKRGPLSDAEIADLERWITEGAVWEGRSGGATQKQEEGGEGTKGQGDERRDAAWRGSGTSCRDQRV